MAARLARATGTSCRRPARRRSIDRAPPGERLEALSAARRPAPALRTLRQVDRWELGRTLYEAITGRDYVVIQGFTLVIAVVYVVTNLVVDISYGFLDPRVRTQ